MSHESILDHVEGLDPLRIAILDELSEVAGRNVITEIAEVFLSEIHQNLNDLRAWKQGGGDLGDTAHRLKGSLANFGANSLGMRCGELETAALETDEARVKAELEFLLPALDHFVVELSTFLRK